MNEELKYNKGDNYYRNAWRVFLDNEQLLKEVQDQASENLKVQKRIFNVENYYETVLLPKLFSFPKQYLDRIKQVKNHQKAQEKKLREQAKISRIALGDENNLI